MTSKTILFTGPAHRVRAGDLVEVAGHGELEVRRVAIIDGGDGVILHYPVVLIGDRETRLTRIDSTNGWRAGTC